MAVRTSVRVCVLYGVERCDHLKVCEKNMEYGGSGSTLLPVGLLLPISRVLVDLKDQKFAGVGSAS